jgi:tRNA A-37 threonylcarbamoyl transferase component Bud32
MAPTVATARRRPRWWLREPASSALEALLADPDRVLTGRASVARQRVGRKRFYRLETEGEAPALFVKVFTVPGGWPRLRSFVRPSKARREARTAAAVRARGFEVAAPLAVGEERCLGTLRRSFSVVPELQGRDLLAWLADPATTRDKRRALLIAFGAFARRLHDAGIDQDDFSPNNFLVDPTGNFVLLDFERCRVRPELGDRRWTLLAKLHRHELSVPRTDRLRFLKAYLGEGAHRRATRVAWREIERAFWRIRRRDARRAARAAFRSGRNVVRCHSTWVVRGREDSAVRRLALGADGARRGWVLAHQLERLSLPALRPVRLGPDWLELLEPSPAPADLDTSAEIRRAASRLERYGVFTEEPEWRFGPQGALLANPTCFRLRL